MDRPDQFIFDNATFAPREGRLRLGDKDVILEQKVVDLLHAFCRRPGTGVDQVMADGGNMAGSGGQTRTAFRLRSASCDRVLGDRAAAPKYIRTVSGTGYLWLPETRIAAVGPPQLPALVGSRSGWWLSSGLVAIGLLVAGRGRLVVQP